MEKGIFVKDIQLNSQITAIFMVCQAEKGHASNGLYWRLKLADATGNIDANIWYPLSESFEQINNGLLVRVSGRVGSYKSRPQINIARFQPCDEEELKQINFGDFMPSSSHDINAMYSELKNLCEQEFRHQAWHDLIFAILEDPDLSSRLRTMPAAKRMHHAWVGGLLEHTLGVFKLCRTIADNYRELDRQTLLAGAILHDIGKILEYSGGMANDYTTSGKLLGHVFLGLYIMEPFLARSSLEPELAEHLRHLILSHHGKYEFGAARLPQTAEALALHYADDLDAKLATYRSAFAESGTQQWSQWQSNMDRQFFRPGQTPQAAENPVNLNNIPEN